MKKILVGLDAAFTLCAAVAPASAHGWRGGYGGGYGGGWHGGPRYGWVAPFAVGAFAGAVVANSYYRPAPFYYGPQYYPPVQRAAAYCPENGLYYPQTQVCPSGWQRVVY